jgi:hypothetical protein
MFGLRVHDATLEVFVDVDVQQNFSSQSWHMLIEKTMINYLINHVHFESLWLIFMGSKIMLIPILGHFPRSPFLNCPEHFRSRSSCGS